MKEQIIVKHGDDILFDGNILNLPLKKKFITELSIKIFDDDDPCIIHQSYVIKEIILNLIGLFKSQNNNILNASSFMDEFNVVDFDDISTLTFELVVK